MIDGDLWVRFISPTIGVPITPGSSGGAVRSQGGSSTDGRGGNPTSGKSGRPV